MGKRRRIETASLIGIFAVILLGSVLGVTGYAIIATLVAVLLWGVVGIGYHMVRELQVGHRAALIYGPIILLVIVWFAVMMISLWFHTIGWPPVE